MSLLTLPLPPHRGSQLRIYVKIRTPPQPGARSEPYRASGSGSRPSTRTWVRIRIRAPIKDPANKGIPVNRDAGPDPDPDPAPDRVRIQPGWWIQTRIRIQNPDPTPKPEPEPDPGGQMSLKQKKVAEARFSNCWMASTFPNILTYSCLYSIP